MSRFLQAMLFLVAVPVVPADTAATAEESYQRGLAAIQKGNWETAKNELTSSWSARPTAMTAYALCKTYSKLKNIEETMTYCKQAYVLSPPLATTFRDAAVSLYSWAKQAQTASKESPNSGGNFGLSRPPNNKDTDSPRPKEEKEPEDPMPVSREQMDSTALAFAALNFGCHPPSDAAALRDCILRGIQLPEPPEVPAPAPAQE